MAYTTLSNALFAVGARITSSLGLALRDNPIAGFQGDDDAPTAVQSWHPYDKTENGDAATGLFYDFAVDGSVSSVTTPDFADGWEYQIAMKDVEHSSGSSQSFQIQLYRATSASYTTAASMITGVTAGSPAFGYIELHACRASRSQHIVLPNVVANNAPASFVMKIGVTSAQKIGKARVLFDASNITAGKMYLYRRKAFYA